MNRRELLTGAATLAGISRAEAFGVGKLGLGEGHLGALGTAQVSRMLVGDTQFALPDNIVDDTTSNSLNSRKICYAPTNSALLDIQLAFPGFGLNIPEADFPVTYTVNSAAVEYPIGTITQVFFGGSASTTVSPGSVLKKTDPLTINIPAGAQFAVKCNVTWSAGHFWLATLTAAQLVGEWTVRGTGLTNHTLDTNALTTTANNAGFCPLVYGRLATKIACVGLIGDSIGTLTSDWVDTASGHLGWGRSMRGAIPFVNLARGADTYALYFTRHSGRDLVLNKAITHLIMQLGINDLNAGASLGTMQTNLTTAIAPYVAAGVQCWAPTFTPHTTSSDSFVTAANQTIVSGAVETVRLAYNSWLRTNYASLGLQGYIDLAHAVDPGDTGKWGFDPTSNLPGNAAALAVLSSGTIASAAPFSYNSNASWQLGWTINTNFPCIVQAYPGLPGSGGVVHMHSDGSGLSATYGVDTAGSGYTYPPMIVTQGTFTADGLHPNARGWARVLQATQMAPEWFVSPPSTNPFWVLPGAVIDEDFANGLYWPRAIATELSDVRASAANAVDASGNWSNFSSNVLRITNAGLTNEPTKTNLETFAQLFSNAVWVPAAATVTSGQTSPDGGTNAFLLADTAANAQHAIGITSAIPITGGSTYTFSLFVKSGAQSNPRLVVANTGFTNTFAATINSTTGVVSNTGSSGTAVYTSAGAIKYPNGWTLIYVTGNLAGGDTGARPYIYLNDGTTYVGSGTGFSMWQAQLELGSLPTSPIVSAGSATARAADAITIQRTGIARIVFTFDDGSQQTVSGISTGSQYTLATNLNRAVITRLTGYAT